MVIIVPMNDLDISKFLPQMTVEYFGTNTKDPKYTFHLLSAEPQHLQIQLWQGETHLIKEYYIVNLMTKKSPY